MLSLAHSFPCLRDPEGVCTSAAAVQCRGHACGRLCKQRQPTGRKNQFNLDLEWYSRYQRLS
jgi:hypothetical protein